MEIETDYYEVKIQIGVGYRTCNKCGKTFAKDMQYPKRTVCPECREKFGKGHIETQKTAAAFLEMKRCEKIEAEKMRERMRKRDAAWARWERENGRHAVVEDHGTSIVEIRGQRCIGVYSVNSVKHT